MSAGRAARLLSGLALGLVGCAAPAEDPRATLLAFHEAQRRAHLEEDAAAMVELLGQGYLDVRDGAVRSPGRAETLARFERYFASVEFLAWEDIEPPVITLSEDGTLATMVVQKLVRLRTADPSGGTRIERTLFAWLATCVRDHGEWKVASVASTRRAVDAEASLAAQRHALGGARAIESVRRVRTTARGSGPSGEYALELDLPRAGAWRLTWRFPGSVDAYEIDGADGFRLGDDGGREAIDAEQVAEVRGHAFPWLAWDLARIFPSPDGMAHGGFERDDAGRSLERLDLADELGRLVTAWIDLETDRLARIELREHVDAQGRPVSPVTLVFESWQTIDGLAVPRVVVALDGRGAWRLELEDVAIER